MADNTIDTTTDEILQLEDELNVRGDLMSAADLDWHNARIAELRDEQAE